VRRRAVHRRSPWLFLAIALAIGPASPVAAQKGARGVAVRAAAAKPEAELPDVDANEKGGAPASVSSRQVVPSGKVRASPAEARDSSEEASSRGLEGAATELGPPGGLYGVEGSGTGAGETDGPGPALPEFHVIKKGDTLWSVCESYFKDPWRWPRLWAQNPRITNPHWIFPGDVIRLHSVAPATAAAASNGLAPGLPGIAPSAGAANTALVLRDIGYVEAKDLEVSAVISGSREEKIMLSTDDQVYLTFPRDRPLKAGERYTVFVADRKHPLRAPGSEADLGYLVHIFGDVRVDQIADGVTARGTLVDMIDSVEREFLVSPLVRKFRRIEPRPSAVNLQSRILASLSPGNMLASETFVVLSRGKKDGVEVGNRTFVVRRADGYRRLMEGWEHFDGRYPNEVVGELWVVDVRDSTSLAWIARTSKEIRIGEIAEMRKGH
jgi:LysM domain